MRYVVLAELIKAVGQERAGHKYIKRERIGTGKYRYWYRLPSGEVVSSKNPSTPVGEPSKAKVPKGKVQWEVKEGPLEKPTKKKGEPFSTPEVEGMAEGLAESFKMKDATEIFKRKITSIMKERNLDVKEATKVLGQAVANIIKEKLAKKGGETTKKVEGEKGDEPVIIYGGKVVHEGTGHAKEHFKQQYGVEAKEGVEVKQPQTMSKYRPKEEVAEMTEEEKKEAKERFPEDPERKARMEKLHAQVLAKKTGSNVYAPQGYEVGKTVKFGNTKLKITDSGEKGFTGVDIYEGDTKRVLWSAVEGFEGQVKKSVEGKAIQFLAENPNPPDKKIHDLSDRMKIETDEFEAKIYGILSDVIEHGKGVKPNLKELAMGVKIEMEHTKYPELARWIAMAHLKEIPDYYSRLKKMENEAKKSGNKS